MEHDHQPTSGESSTLPESENPSTLHQQPIIDGIQDTFDECSMTQKYTTDLNGNLVPISDMRPINQPIKMGDYFCSFATSKSKSKGTAFPIHDYLTHKRFSHSQTDYLDKISTTAEPSTFKEAIQYPSCIHAMNEELATLELNDTWEIVSRSKDRKGL